MFIFDFFRKKKKLDQPWEKFYSDEDLKYKIPNISIYRQVKESAEKYPKNVAIQYLGKKINYNQFMQKIDIAANELVTSATTPSISMTLIFLIPSTSSNLFLISSKQAFVFCFL